VLAGTLAGRPEARLAAAGAAFAEALGWPLAREVRLRALTRDGRLLAVARTEHWAEQVRALAPAIVERMNARLGAGATCAVEVRTGPLGREDP
jgi:electron transfer flavoprotein alpha/beta subunit